MTRIATQHPAPLTEATFAPFSSTPKHGPFALASVLALSVTKFGFIDVERALHFASQSDVTVVVLER